MRSVNASVSLRQASGHHGSIGTVRLTTPDTQPGFPLSHVEPFSGMAAAFSQQNTPAGLSGYRPSGTYTHVAHLGSAQQMALHAVAVVPEVEFILMDA